MIHQLLKKIALKNFFQIDLSSMERQIAEESLREKYAPAVKASLISICLSVPAIAFLDTTTIVGVLIPSTTVAGTAWYAVSLANLKKKFESFGTELTRNLFESFLTSLGLLLLVTLFSLVGSYVQPFIDEVPEKNVVLLISGLLGTAVVGRLLFKIFLGSLQYDINDSLLTGQNEAAERFFKKSLSLLNSTASSLRGKSNSLQVANYLIGVSFFEVFSFYQTLTGEEGHHEAEKNIELSNKLIKNPAMSQKEADGLVHKLITHFLDLIREDLGDVKAMKSIRAIRDELECLETNPDEDQAMVDTRASVVLEEIADLLESQGENLFLQPRH